VLPEGRGTGACADIHFGMRQFYAVGLALLALFELANVYFIMPLPGSQRMRSLDLAYTLWSARWVVRGIAGTLLALGALALLRDRSVRRWWVLAPLTGLVAALAWYVNFRMAADQMFRPPTVLRMASAADNGVALDRLVVGVVVNGEARAYPLQYIGYHHHLRDRVGGQDVLVTYCTVCRTGRVFSPFVGAEEQTFRLVGMDNFNAMLEDERTGSWWRQANGEAVVGPRQGTVLPEIPSRQMTLARWLSLYPASRIMQADNAFLTEYAKDYAYERGTSRKKLTGTDTSSWGEKSWVVGITIGAQSRAYDWNHLERTKAINDVLDGTPLVIALASDSLSFFAFERPSATALFRVEDDSLVTGEGGTRRAYAFNGQGASDTLTALVASQEFWHSWRTFQPTTSRYPAESGTITVRTGARCCSSASSTALMASASSATRLVTTSSSTSAPRAAISVSSSSSPNR
jgi:hypothetical protein